MRRAFEFDEITSATEISHGKRLFKLTSEIPGESRTRMTVLLAHEIDTALEGDAPEYTITGEQAQNLDALALSAAFAAWLATQLPHNTTVAKD